MYEAKIIADSTNGEDRLTTFVVTYPRFVHSELMTHRMFSRNAGSSRAIPINKMIDKVLEDPVIPVWWGRNQSGMQAQKEIEAKETAKVTWLTARNKAVQSVRELSGLDLHKQLANRLLEPWMWITVIISATDFDNFFRLRTPLALESCSIEAYERGFDPQFPAQPEIQVAATNMYRLYTSSEPELLVQGEWHLPFITEEEKDTFATPKLLKMSVARCARVSYLNHEQKIDTTADLKLHDTLTSNGHWSPFEHQAISNKGFSSGNFNGFLQYRKMFVNEYYQLKG